jgi:hypothetical protein
LRTYVFGVDRDSSVGIATGYGLDGLGVESRWGRDFPHLLISNKMGTGYLLRANRPGHGLNNPSPSSPKVKERVELLLPLWVFIADYRVNLTY